MQRFLPSLWLVAAALYAAATLFLNHALFAAARRRPKSPCMRRLQISSEELCAS